MTKLRICIGLIAAALLVGAVPANAVTTRFALVCAQLKTGEKITGVKFGWASPINFENSYMPGWLSSTVSGTATTDKSGCFGREIPTGKVAFRYGFYPIDTSVSNSEQTLFVTMVRPLIVDVPISGVVTVTLPRLPYYKLLSSQISARDPNNALIPSSFAFKGVAADVGCNKSSFDASFDTQPMSIFLTYGSDQAGFGLSSLVLAAGVRKRSSYIWVDMPFPIDRTYNRSLRVSNDLGFGANGKIRFKGFKSSWKYPESDILYQTCMRAKANFGGKSIEGYSFLSFPKTSIKYDAFLAGFNELPEQVKARSGKVALVTRLHDSTNLPIAGVQLNVSEPKASNPNIGKKVGSCKPVLTATTNAQGKATFTLCPTKNTTVTVKAPPLGIVSQSIAVKK